MVSEMAFVLSEAFDFAAENPFFIASVAILSFYVGLEVSGYGVLIQIIHQRREKKLNDDLVRVRELQQQLGVLRALRSKRNALASEQQQGRGGETEVGSKKDDNLQQPPRRESKVRFSNKQRNLSLSALVREDPAVSDGESSDSTNESAEPSDFTNKGKDAHSSNSNGNGNGNIGNELGAASHAYEALKDAWTWGRHETPLAPILGLTEGLASNVIGLFGTDLKGIDDGLKPHVADLDEHVLKPTLSNVSQIWGGLNKENTEELTTTTTAS